MARLTSTYLKTRRFAFVNEYWKLVHQAVGNFIGSCISNFRFTTFHAQADAFDSLDAAHQCLIAPHGPT